STTLESALAIQSGRVVTTAAGQLAKEAMGMSALTKRAIALGAALALVCGASIVIAGGQLPGKAAKPTPVEPEPPQAVKRDQFNDVLPPKAIARMGTIAFRHRGNCELAYALDGKVLISTGHGSVRVWDSISGQERFVIGGIQDTADDHVVTAGLQADGKTMSIFERHRLRPGKGLEFRN